LNFLILDCVNIILQRTECNLCLYFPLNKDQPNVRNLIMKQGGYLISFLFCSIFSFGQTFHSGLIVDFGNIGLQITDIKQDKTGFLWIGTIEGLYRYDGYNFKLYETDKKTIGSSIIQKIYVAKNDELWVCTNGGGLLNYNPRLDKLVQFIHDSTNTKSIGANNINNLVEDREGNLWIAFSRGGLDFYNKQESTFYHFLPSDKSGLLSDDLSDVLLEENNTLWISTWNDGVNSLDLNNARNKIPSQAKFKSYPVEKTFPKQSVLTFLYKDTLSGELYIGSNAGGLFKYSRTQDRFNLVDIPSLQEYYTYGMTPVGDHKVLLPTNHGILLMNLENQALEPVPSPLNEVLIQVYTVFIDNQKNTWVGTDRGLTKIVEKKIAHYKIDPTKNFAPINNILGLCKQGDYVWLGTYGGGLYLKNEKTAQIVRVNKNNEQLNYIWDIKRVGNFLHVGTHMGLVTLDVSDLTLRQNFKEKTVKTLTHFTCFTKNTAGDTWVGTWNDGIFKIDNQTGEAKRVKLPHMDNHYVQAVLIDKKNQLWVGTRHSGMIRYSNLDGKVETKFYPARKPHDDVSSEFITALYEDDKGQIWIGTGEGGLNILDDKTEKITWIGKGERNLPSNTVKAITQDKEGHVWVSFKIGMSRYDPDNGFINFSQEDGLEFMEFNFNGAIRADSLLYFSNQSGYNSFRPEDLKFQATKPRVIITELKVNNKPFLPGVADEFGNLMTKPVYEAESVSLNYKASTISFEFSSLDYTHPMREVYAYKLDGISTDWTYTNASNRQVTYSNLSPGKYTFHVKVIRNDMTGNEGTRAIDIIIIPPFWQTTWFKVIAGMLLVGFVYTGHAIRLSSIRSQKIKFERLADERIKVIEKKNIEIQNQTVKLHEADKSKLNFFTNISHEFRTPLMLIIGPLNNLLETKPNAENEKLMMIHRNAQRLLRLMDQIMDISKIDAGSLRLELREGDIVKFVQEIKKSFDYLSQLKKIQFEFQTKVQESVCLFDHDKIEKILYNLLSNAFKATPQYGSVSMEVEITEGDSITHRLLHIKIENTGIGISKEDLPNLFTRFYRTKNYADGTGIGLSLTKSLVELQGGTIEVVSEEKSGTTFHVTVPVGSQGVGKNDNIIEIKEQLLKIRPSEPLPATDESSVINRSADPNSRTILIVEDDEDMRRFISELLEESYSVIRAGNGDAGLKLAYQFQPDLIISDMIMPVMDGYQFMRAIKSDTNVSHIPIILLSTRDTVDARLQGLEEGADDYITKPFNEKLLLARVKNLIEQRRSMKERFSTDINLKAKEITITSLDEKFMQKLVDVVELHISNPDFGSDLICQELGIGRSYLYSKVRAITDLSVNEFIKTMRLKRAAVLLLSGEQNVNEVSLNVGFMDRSHFSKSFTKQFGMSPAQYQKEKHHPK
jgi:signal transduction histidine kinase/DNA-binding response OmpR family regulator/ligand-binding sensor domain-containing protein